MSEEFRVSDWLAEGVEGIKSKVQMPRVDLMPEAFGDHMRASAILCQIHRIRN